MIAFHGTLLEDSVRQRYMAGLSYDRRIAHNRLTRVCAIDYDTEMALVAEALLASGEPGDIAGVGRLVREIESNSAEFALIVADRFQRQGLRRKLLNELISVGREEKLCEIYAWIFPSNMAMQNLSRKLGFEVFLDSAEGLVRATISVT